jgi:hypothetical protein
VLVKKKGQSFVITLHNNLSTSVTMPFFLFSFLKMRHFWELVFSEDHKNQKKMLCCSLHFCMFLTKKPSLHFFLPKTLPHMPKKSNASTNRKKMKKTDDSSIYEDEAIPCLFLLLKRKKYCGKKALKNSKCKIDLQSLFFFFR